MYLAEMIEIYHVDEKSSFELDRLVQSQGQIVDLITKCGRRPKTAPGVNTKSCRTESERRAGC